MPGLPVPPAGIRNSFAVPLRHISWILVYFGVLRQLPAAATPHDNGRYDLDALRPQALLRFRFKKGNRTAKAIRE